MSNVTPCEADQCLDCGGPQSGPARWHWGNCQIRFGQPLPPEAFIRDELMAEIRNVSTELDARYGNNPGTAERALYWAYWPPSASTDINTLCHLLNDAREFLAAAPAAPAARRHSPTSRRNTRPRRQRRRIDEPGLVRHRD